MGTDILKVNWSKKENDFMIHYPRSCDGNLIQDFLFGKRYAFNGIKEKDIREELEKRGYDLTTLKFSIKRKDSPKP